MKKSLGNLFLLLLLTPILTFAQQAATYTIEVSDKTPHIKEAVLVTITAKQLDHTKVMFFFAHPKKDDAYKIEFLNKETQEISLHDSSAVFRFVLFPLKAKKIQLSFECSIRTTNDKSIAQAYVSDHDDSIAIESDAMPIDVKPLTLHVKEYTKDIDLVGDFQLRSSIDKTQVSQYETTNIHYTLYGDGYAYTPKLIKQIENVDIFSDIEKSHTKLTAKGHNIKYLYTYALSAKEDYLVQSITLQAFSPTKNEYYTLTAPSYSVHVNKIDTNTILDKEESPKQSEFVKLEDIRQFFIYILIFLAGYFTAKVPFSISSQREDFQDIQRAKNAKKLLIILLNNYKNRDIDKFIEALEGIAFAKESGNFQKIKKELLAFLKKG